MATSGCCSGPARGARGFTLVELLLVVVVLGVLSAVALPHATDHRTDAVGSTLRANVNQVGMVLEYRRQQTAQGDWPLVIEPAWFLEGVLPHHPDQMAGVPAVEIVSEPGRKHPRDIVVKPGSFGAYWYNTAEGSFRARVRALDDGAATQAFYDYVNVCAASGSGAQRLDG